LTGVNNFLHGETWPDILSVMRTRPAHLNAAARCRLWAACRSGARPAFDGSAALLDTSTGLAPGL